MAFSPSGSSSTSTSSSIASTSSTSSSSSRSIHHASLVDPALHSSTLLRLLETQRTTTLIDYVVDKVAATVNFALGRTPADVTTPRSPHVVKFRTFVYNVLTRAEITTPVILSALVYVERAQPHLHIALEEWALERVFLGAVIVASKYLNDSTLKNIHWSMCTGTFGKRDVGRIEREFLEVLEWNLAVTEAELLLVAGERDTTPAVVQLGQTKEHAIVIDEDDDDLAEISIAVVESAPHVYEPRRHQRVRHHSRTSSIPQLDPSSPSGSSSSSSASSSPFPRTPGTVDLAFERPQKSYSHSPSTFLPHQQQRPRPAPKKQHAPHQAHHRASFADLIRAFPHLPSHGHGKHSALNFGVRVAAS